MFLRNSWYVCGWGHDVGEVPVGRTVIGEPIVVWRDADGEPHAMEDRCPHRHAPLSLGRVEGATIRCMYHGMAFDGAGRCIGMPLLGAPPGVSVRVYPIVERDGWLWIWMGDPGRDDRDLIPRAFGIDDPDRPMRYSSIEYDAHYQLIHDNLCDLSHLDFVHARTLRPATGASWSETAPRITMQDRSIRVERWLRDAEVPNRPDVRLDVWSSYTFAVPGIFIMEGRRFPAGTAERCGGLAPDGIEPINHNLEQQAVTPISDRRTAYHYATGLVGSTPQMTLDLQSRMDVVMAAFEEDRAMIEAQQRIWDLTPSDRARHFLPQDKGPHMMRKLMARLIEAER